MPELGDQQWRAIIDTGFNGDVELPEILQSQLDGECVGTDDPANDAATQIDSAVDVPNEQHVSRRSPRKLSRNSKIRQGGRHRIALDEAVEEGGEPPDGDEGSLPPTSSPAIPCVTVLAGTDNDVVHRAQVLAEPFERDVAGKSGLRSLQQEIEHIGASSCR